MSPVLISVADPNPTVSFYRNCFQKLKFSVRFLKLLRRTNFFFFEKCKKNSKKFNHHTGQVWDLETGQRLVTLRSHTDGVTCLQFNDFYIVSGALKTSVSNPNSIKSVPAKNLNPIQETINPNPSYFLTLSEKKLLHFYKIFSSKEVN